MKTKLKTQLIVLLLLALSGPTLMHAQGTAFQYQGRLVENGVAANGTYDFIFTVHAAEVGGNALSGPVTLNAIAVSGGQFVAPLDFGAGIFTGAARWLQIGVRAKGVGAHIPLVPRQALLPTPYAIFAGSAASVANGTVTAKQLNTAGAAPGPGQFLSYNGGSLIWSDPAVVAGNIWSRLNNNAYYSAGNVGIGTSNPLSKLEVKTGSGTYGFTHTDGAITLGSYIGSSTSGATGGWLGTQSNHPLYFFVNNGQPGMTLDPSGSVGIGTSTPLIGVRLHVEGSAVLQPGGSGGGFISFGTPSAETGMTINGTGTKRADVRFDGTTLKLLATTSAGAPSSVNGITINAASGNVGIGGSPTPVAKLEVVGQDALRLIGFQPFLTLYDSNAGFVGARIQNVNGAMVLEPQSVLDGSNPNASVVIANSGNVSLRSLTIRGGADVAEPFELTTPDIVKGSVVVIDDEHPGKLKLSTHAYDTQVAGIVSGANGIEPGISLYQKGALEGGQNVALSGRVYVLADASKGAIKPGDLLTTSGTPGHAMRVADHSNASGSILGKAMSALKEGKGMVLVLVTLQ